MKRLKQTLEIKYREKHPAYPADLTIPVKSYDLNKANGLTQAVIAWIKAHGYQAERISNTGRPIDNRKQVIDSVGFTRTIGSIEWIPGTGTTGTADISATIPLIGSNGFGVSVKIEIKAGRDTIKPEQIAYGEQVKQAGGVYVVVRNMQDFYKWWDENVQNS